MYLYIYIYIIYIPWHAIISHYIRTKPLDISFSDKHISYFPRAPRFGNTSFGQNQLQRGYGRLPGPPNKTQVVGIYGILWPNLYQV